MNNVTTDKPVAQIARENGMSTSTVYHWLDGGPPTGPFHLEPIPRRRTGAVRCGKHRRLTGDRAAIVQSIWRTAESQVLDIEDRLMQSGQAPAERERDARAMAVLVKTMRELSALDNARNPNTIDDDDDMPRDIDEFRRELARRMAAFVESRTGRAIPGDAETS